MYYIEKVKREITKKVNRALGKDLIEVSNLSYPQQAGHGDISVPMFILSKSQGKSPAEMATELVGKIEINGIIAGVKATGPYLNFTLKNKEVIKGVIDEIEIQGDEYGKNNTGNKRRVMIEYSNVNTHKEFHIGHVRNISLGDSIHRILSANGYKTIPVSYINDFGIHVARTLWAYLEYYQDQELPENKGEFLGSVYVRAATEIKKNETAKQLASFMMKKIESKEGEEYELWKKTREWSIAGFDKIYRELGIKFEHIFYESEFIDKGREMIPGLIKKGVLKESQGAVIADFEDEGKSVLVVLRSDGTATYPVADIPLAMAKFEKYDLDSSIYVVDNRQKLYFKQLFGTLKRLGYQQDMVHLDYDFVTLPSGSMSSRSGNAVSYSELRAMLTKRMTEEAKKRHDDWSDEKIEQAVRVIVNGSMKFEMLKVGASQVITFDEDKALESSGYTAVYLQYVYARIKSILRKAKNERQKEEISYAVLTEDKEHQLVMKLSKYSEMVKRAGDKYNTSEVAKYVFELGQLFNDYYHSTQILKSDDDIRDARLALASAVSQVIKNGLDLLGIEVVDEM